MWFQNVQGGQRIVGQLGHGDTAAYKTPKKVEAFEGVGVIQAECGEDFTVCLTGSTVAKLEWLLESIELPVLMIGY